jgi:TonB family protein
MPKMFCIVFALGAWLLMPDAAFAQAHEYQRCITFDTTSNTLTSFLVNRCDVRLNVTWVDAGDCRTRCQLAVGPRGRQSAGNFKPPALWAACLYPDSARSDDGLKTFSCPSRAKPNAPQANNQTHNQAGNPPNNPAARPTTGAAPPEATKPPANKPRPSGRFLAATPLVRMTPEFPPRAQARGISGWVHVAFNIDAQGRVSNVRVIDAAPKSMFDQAALRAVAGWRYNPATRGGQPVASTMETVVKFQIDGEDLVVPEVAASRPLGGAPAAASASGGGGRSQTGGGLMYGTDRFVPNSPRAGGFVAVSGSYRQCNPVNGSCTNYYRMIAASGRDAHQARDNARRKFSSDQTFPWAFPEEILACDYGGWYSAIRGANSARVMGNDAYRFAFACGHPTREAALRAAMQSYFRVGGVVYDDVAYYVGLASGSNYTWQDAPGYYGIVMAPAGEQFESCTVAMSCNTPYVGWSLFGR